MHFGRRIFYQLKATIESNRDRDDLMNAIRAVISPSSREATPPVWMAVLVRKSVTGYCIINGGSDFYVDDREKSADLNNRGWLRLPGVRGARAKARQKGP